MNLVSDLAHWLLLAALLARVGEKTLGRPWGARRGAAIGLAIAVLLSLLPGGWNPAFHTRALLGDPGALGWIFLLHLLFDSLAGKKLLSRGEGEALAWPALVGAALIYPASLGVPGAPDFYKADFGGFALPGAALALALFYLGRGFFVAATGVAGGLLLYGFRLHESANLWDCLFDLPSVLVAIVILARSIRSRRLRRGAGGVSLAATPES